MDSTVPCSAEVLSQISPYPAQRKAPLDQTPAKDSGPSHRKRMTQVFSGIWVICMSIQYNNCIK